MVGQTALVLDAPAKKQPVRYRILDTLRDGRWHSGLEWVNGDHGFYCLSYSQRIGDLKREGHDIESECHGGVARYRLIPTERGAQHEQV
jgi:hypothetical protein